MHSSRHGLRTGLLGCLALGLLLAGADRVAARAAEKELPWSPDLKKGLEAARKSGKNVFIDFTGFT